jgi:acyl carrier protein
MSDTESWTKTEHVVRTVWSEVLGVEDIQKDGDFFALGGDSLLMIDMLFALNDALGVELDPGLLFEGSSLVEFAGLVDQHLLTTSVG